MTVPPPPPWIERLLAGDRVALSRAITAVENDGAETRAVLGAIHDRLGRALVVGVTGPPGAGKSTLTGAYVALLRSQDKRVGVVAVDPSSPLTGGALLGDRIRLTGHADDPGVFVRSLANRGQLGGLARNAAHVVDVMDAAGMNVIVVETVGTGQSEVEITGLAEVRVVVAAPGLGDEIQALKAGILEIADILVVNKADRAGAERAARQLARAGRTIAGGVPVLQTVATSGAGVAALAQAIAAAAGARRRPAPRERARRLVAGAAADALRAALTTRDDPRLDALCDAVCRGEIDIDAAAARARALVEDSDGNRRRRRGA